MPVALVQIKAQPSYRRDAFAEGLQRLGYQVTFNVRGPDAGGLLLTWNTHGSIEAQAQLWRDSGAKHIVAENGAIGRIKGVQLYALARNQHNVPSNWPVGDEDRWPALGLKIRPWRSTPDGHILVCGQRSIGSRRMRSPENWHVTISKELQARNRKRRIDTRPHPGKPANETADELRSRLTGAYACVVWASANGVHALAEGIPVFYAAPNWIGEQGAKKIGADLDVSRPLMDDAARAAALKTVSYGQWTVEEIATGEPFKALLAHE